MGGNQEALESWGRCFLFILFSNYVLTEVNILNFRPRGLKMSKTKQHILTQALILFNQQGVADVSIRQIAQLVGISHSNLLYHFKSKAEIIHGLHDQLLARAVELNQGIDPSDSMIGQLMQTTKLGFEVVYDYRFLFFDLLYIAKTIPSMRKTLIEVEQVRSQMYEGVIKQAILAGELRQAEYEDEYTQLIKRIKIFSDHWLASASIYESTSKRHTVAAYAKLFMGQFYPYLTEHGKEVFRKEKLG